MNVVATAGHVDHGKSTLVRALTGMEPDRYAEERRRGMTIDLGFAWTELAGGPLAFVDVPGHERFVTTMLAGVGPVPAVLLVVAADEGWMPQTAEHVDALVALGVRHGLLVVTRSDLMEPELARDEALAHLASTPLAGLPAVTVSAATGTGMAGLRAALATLVSSLPAPDPGADVRLWVDRAFTIRGAGTVVTGTLGGGRIRVGDELELAGASGSRPVGVRGLQCLGAPVETAEGVSRVAVNLRGLPREATGRGDVLLTPGAWLTTDVLDVRVHGVRGPAPDPRDLPAELTVHVGSAAVPARVRPLGPDTARLRLARALPLRIGDRLVLRDPGRRCVAAGTTVLDVRPPALRRRGSAAARAAELAAMAGRPDALDELRRRGPVRRSELVAMGVPPADLAHLAGSRAVEARGWLLGKEHLPERAAALAAAVAAHDAADPLDPGLSPAAACRAAGLPDPALLEALLPHAEGLRLAGGRVVAGDGPVLPDALRAATENLRADLAADPFAAPDAARLAELGLGRREIATLARTGDVLRLGEDVVLLPDAADRAVAVLARLGPEFSLSEARQALRTSRRVAVPLVEHLARRGYTERTPDGGHRLVVQPAPPPHAPHALADGSG